jgi:hypothetical protein
MVLQRLRRHSRVTLILQTLEGSRDKLFHATLQTAAAPQLQQPHCDAYTHTDTPSVACFLLCCWNLLEHLKLRYWKGVKAATGAEIAAEIVTEIVAEIAGRTYSQTAVSLLLGLHWLLWNWWNPLSQLSHVKHSQRVKSE